LAGDRFAESKNTAKQLKIFTFAAKRYLLIGLSVNRFFWMCRSSTHQL